jgi:hypothetical protein
VADSGSMCGVGDLCGPCPRGDPRTSRAAYAVGAVTNIRQRMLGMEREAIIQRRQASTGSQLPNAVPNHSTSLRTSLSHRRARGVYMGMQQEHTRCHERYVYETERGERHPPPHLLDVQKDSLGGWGRPPRHSAEVAVVRSLRTKAEHASAGTAAFSWEGERSFYGCK